MLAWYAVYTHARMEQWARTNLWERGFEVYLPTYRKQRRHARKVDWVSAPFFPRYLFVRADLERGHKRRIATAPGVSHMVAFGNRTPAVADTVIAEIRRREDENGHVSLCDPESLNTGDQVRLHNNVLQDQIAFFQCRSDDDRVVVLLDILGRQVRAKVPAASISRVA